MVSSQLPEELAPILLDKTLVCSYASIKRDGTPITAPLAPFPGENGRTIDLATGLSYPWKAERARRNPRVSLLYSEPNASLVDDPPTILVYGHATIYDSDLQANLDRFIKLAARSESFSKTPAFLLRWVGGYLARIWISVTPLKISWWPKGDISRPARQWRAPEDTHLPPSDPPPKPLSAPHKAVVTLKQNWREDIAYALQQMRPPILTVVDDEGYPVPFRAQKASLQSEGVRLELPAVVPAEAKGRACLTFYALQTENGEMVSNETISFVGDANGEKDSVLFEVERQLANLRVRPGLKGMLSNLSEMRRMGKRAEIEAARRGQPVPEVRLPIQGSD